MGSNFVWILEKNNLFKWSRKEFIMTYDTIDLLFDVVGYSSMVAVLATRPIHGMALCADMYSSWLQNPQMFELSKAGARVFLANFEAGNVDYRS